MYPWPDELTEVFDKSLTVTFVSITKSGQPISVPLTPYVNPETNTLDVSTGLTYPAKAERARNNPCVSLLYSDPIGLSIDSPPVVLVQGHAAIRDNDLQANTDRYIKLSSMKLPESTKGQPKIVLQRLPWYFARIWIEITPIEIFWWPNHNMALPPQHWQCDTNQVLPSSDPPPQGSNLPAWLSQPTEWMQQADIAQAKLHLRDLSFVTQEGKIMSVPVQDVHQHAEGFSFELPKCIEPLPAGKATMTFHNHPVKFTGQENRTFLGAVESQLGQDTIICNFNVRKVLADWSLPGNRLTMAVSFLSKGRKLAPRLKLEAERRNQPIPKVRFLK